MFPDPTAEWQPYPSAIDGIERPPSVFDRGFWLGVLYLIVISPKRHLSHYGIEIRCDAYFGVEEMIYSITDHGTGTVGYNGGVYIKEAKNSALLTTYRSTDPFMRTPRHFAFVGADFCYEALSFSDPVIRTFASREEAYAWGPARSE